MAWRSWCKGAGVFLESFTALRFLFISAVLFLYFLSWEIYVIACRSLFPQLISAPSFSSSFSPTALSSSIVSRCHCHSWVVPKRNRGLSHLCLLESLGFVRRHFSRHLVRGKIMWCLLGYSGVCLCPCIRISPMVEKAS